MNPDNTYPGSFFLTTDVAAVASYLAVKSWLEPDEVVESVARAGEGNMNCVMRVVTSERTFILKQSRPWVEKYPGIPAPWDRALIEARFYRTVEQHQPVAGYLARLFGFDAEERLLMLEDLGESQDFTSLYAEGAPGPEQAQLRQLIDFLIALHTSFRTPDLAAAFSNSEMRALNYEHIFALPLRRHNGLNLDSITPGLAALALHLQEDAKYCGEVAVLGDRYVHSSHGVCLIHGDYFPGSWLKARQGVYVIDPEFCFFGPPEWDLGVMIAHLYLAGQSHSSTGRLLSRYAAAAPVDRKLVLQFAGVEIMRRLTGVAQLPLKLGKERKAELLELSRQLVMEGKSA